MNNQPNNTPEPQLRMRPFRRVVITGMGAVTPLGNTMEETWANARAGKCGIGPIQSYDPEGMKVTLAGEVRGLIPEERVDKKHLRREEKFTKFALVAAQEAFEQSGLNIEEEDASRCGCLISSGIGGFESIGNERVSGAERGYDRVSPYFIPRSIANIAAGKVAIMLGLKGSCTCIVTACAAGSHAVGEAFHQIRDGYADIVVAGGTESSITELAVGGFTSMRALSTSTNPNRASIPFDAERNGFVIGEGAAALVLEEHDHAVARGAQILGEIVGYAATCDAHHVTAPEADGAGAALCMANALADAGITADQIGYVNAHGTSTSMNDSCETAAMHHVFCGNAANVPVSSTKSMTGHLLGASGAVEAVLVVKALQDGFLPPNINYQVPDEACDLNIVANQGIESDARYAMSNSFGFGGHNASLVFAKVGA